MTKVSVPQGRCSYRGLSCLSESKRRFENLNFLIQRWRECLEGETRRFLRAEILQLAATASEFSATLRAFIDNELGWEM